MKVLLLGLAAAVLMASPAIAQPAPSPAPTPVVTPFPPPPPIQVNVDLDHDPEAGSACKWWQVKCQWDEMWGEKKQEWRSKAQQAVTTSLGFMAKMLISPSPFDSARVRELWLKVAGPIAIAMVALMCAWASGKGAIGNPHHLRPGELFGRAGIALTAGAGAIFIIPWLIGFANDIATQMSFADLIQTSDMTRNIAKDAGFVNTFVLLVAVPIAVIVICFLVFRWVLLTLWCIGSPIGAVPYTLPTTEDVSFTFAKGLAVMIGAPIVEMLFISIMVWILGTGHATFGPEVGQWIDAVLVLALFGGLLVWELYVFKTVLGIGNRLYVSVKQAMRSARFRASRWANSGGY